MQRSECCECVDLVQHIKTATIATHAPYFNSSLRSPQDPKAHLRFIFQEMDKDGGGMVEKQEFVKALDTFGFRLNVKQIKRLCDRLDSDRDGSIDFKEFVSFCEESDESQEHLLLLDKRGGKNSESDKELAKLLQFELKRISMGKVSYEERAKS